MKYYQISASPDHKIIGVKNGIYQVEIDENSVVKMDNYLEFRQHFSRKNQNFWNEQEKIYRLFPPALHGKMLKNAKVTDVMGYAPGYRFLDYIYSDRFIDIFKVFNHGNYKTFDINLRGVGEKYNFLFLETIINEEINFEQSSIITGHKALNDVKHHQVRNKDEYYSFLQQNPLGKFEKIAIPRQYFEKDIISIQAIPNKFYSEKLVDFLLDCDITGLQIGYNNSVQLEFI